MTLTENTLTVKNLDWFYREMKPENEHHSNPVLLLHGLPSHSYTWRKIMPDLAKNGFYSMAPDWIGSGFSAKPDKRDFSYTTDSYVTALQGFIEALEVESVSLILQGFLGHLGIQYAFTHPEKIHRLIILNTPLAPTDKLPAKMKQWGFPLLGDMLTQDPLLVDRTLEGGSGFVISDQDLAIYRKPYLKSSSVGRALGTTIKRLQLGNTLTDWQQKWSTWEKPTLIVWGVADPWLSIDEAEKLAKTYSNIELETLVAGKHYPQEHWFEEITPLIVNFLRRQTL